MRELSVPVLIVGAGPAGLSASALLQKFGIKTLTISRHSGVANSPRAHITNQRTMEVFRALGIEEQVKRAAMPNSLMSNNVWATTFSGVELARLQAYGTGEDRMIDYATASPCVMCNIPQHILDPMLLDTAKKFGGSFLFNTELLDMEVHEEHVLARVIDHRTQESFSIRAQYVIGADGANSRVAQVMGFEFDGNMGLGTVVSCWFDADLSQYCEHRPGVLYWMTKPDDQRGLCGATFTCVKPWNEWVMAFGIDPTTKLDLDHESMRAYARKLIDDPHVDIQIRAVSQWTVNRMAAVTMQKGRVFLAGDAAHRHPPMNGLGSNTSIQDSFNLAWKLAMVLKGKAAASLLATYCSERTPVAHQIVDRAYRSMLGMQTVTDALGLIPGRSTSEQWQSLHQLFEDTAQGQTRRAELDLAIKLQHQVFNCHGVEMGQAYSSSAVLADGTQRKPHAQDPEHYYCASTSPGAPLPHAWIECHHTRLSTIDLVGCEGFSLLTGLSGIDWGVAVKYVEAKLGIKLSFCMIGPGCEIRDPDSNWERLREVSDSGCILVRPDRHIAWRSRGCPDQASEVLLNVMTSVLWSTQHQRQRTLEPVA